MEIHSSSKNEHKSIHLFLDNGFLDGFIECRIDNWNFTIYKVPRIEIHKCREWPNLRKDNLYFLFGRHDNEEQVYIGQSSERSNGKSIEQRLREHEKDQYKDFWTEAVILVFNDSAWGKTELCYLESEFYEIIRVAKPNTLKNGKRPDSGSPHQTAKSILGIFIDHAKFIIGLLGYRIFISENTRLVSTTQQKLSKNSKAIFYIGNKHEASKQAYGRFSDKFILLADSYIDINRGDNNRRIQYSHLINSNGKLKEDIYFSSSSAAASFVLGRSASGPLEWKTDDGKSLKDFNNS
jgi:hypothetical protein